jgi:hypothetical protein
MKISRIEPIYSFGAHMRSPRDGNGDVISAFRRAGVRRAGDHASKTACFAKPQHLSSRQAIDSTL